MDKKQNVAFLLEVKITMFVERWQVANTVIEFAFGKLAANPIAVVMLQVISSFSGKFSEKTLFISSKNCKKFLVCRDYCVDSDTPANSSLTICEFHIFLFAEKSGTIWLVNWTVCASHVNTWSVFTLYSNSDSVLYIGEKRRNIRFFRENCISQQNWQKDRRNSQHAMKRLLHKKFKNHLLTLFHKPKIGCSSVFVEWVEGSRGNKFEFELMKLIDCFLDGCGGYRRNLVSLKKHAINLSSSNRNRSYFKKFDS